MNNLEVQPTKSRIPDQGVCVFTSQHAKNMTHTLFVGTNRLFVSTPRVGHILRFLRVSILSADDFFLRLKDRHAFCHTFRASARSARASPVSERLPLAKRAIYLTGIARRCGAKPRDSGGRAYVNGALLLRVEHVCVSRRPAECSTAWGPATSAPRRWAAARRNTHNVRLVACFTTSPTAEGDTRLVRI